MSVHQKFCHQRGSHVMITQDALDLTIKGNPAPSPLLPLPSPRHGTALYRDLLCPYSLPVTSGGQDWRPVQTCQLEDTPPQWLLEHIRSASGLYASHWNAFLLPPANKVWDKVICLQVCVCPQGGQCLVPGGSGPSGGRWGACSGGGCLVETPRRLLLRAVRILLECILVSALASS